MVWCSFLALTPHPCAEVIYWSADSKLLVIAEVRRLSFDQADEQPDRVSRALSDPLTC